MNDLHILVGILFVACVVLGILNANSRMEIRELREKLELLEEK